MTQCLLTCEVNAKRQTQGRGFPTSRSSSPRLFPLQAEQSHPTLIHSTGLEVAQPELIPKHLSPSHRHLLAPTHNHGVDAPEAAASAAELA